MPCGEKRLVFVYWSRGDCEACLQVVGVLRALGYGTLVFCWDGHGGARADESTAFDAADYRLLIDLGNSSLAEKEARRQMLDRALSKGKPTIELSRTGQELKCRFSHNRVVRRVRVGNNLADGVCKAVKEDGWRATQPWRITALTDLLVSRLKCLRPLDMVKAVLPTLEGPDKDPADWWTLLAAGLALASCLLTKPYRVLLSVLLPWPRLAWAAFYHSVTGPLLFACLEIMGIVVTQVEILFVARRKTEREGKVYRRVSRERSLLCALLNYATIVLWFATFYQWFPWLFTSEGGLRLTRPLDALYVSLANMSLMGATVESRHPCGRLILLAQLALGLFMALVVIAQAVGSIQHRSMDES